MKVVCDGCQAKYKLTDGRLAGRTLKFRCRKCGNTIVLDGAEFHPLASAPSLSMRLPDDAFAQEAAAPFEAAPPEWYLSLNGEPYGPCTTDQMSSLLCDGQVPWETFVWREGYADWKAASESQTLVTSAEALLAHAQSGAGAYNDDFASVLPAASAGFDDQDWSNASFRSHDTYAGSLVGRGSHARSGAHIHDEPTRPAFVDPNTGQSPFGDSETSGLIDIRALAALAGGGRTPGLGAVQPDTARGDDDRHSFTSPGERLSGRPDTLAPIDREGSPRSKAVPFAILSGFALIAAAMFVAIYSSSSASSGTATAVSDETPIAPIADPRVDPGVDPRPALAPEPAGATSPPAGELRAPVTHKPARPLKPAGEDPAAINLAANGAGKPVAADAEATAADASKAPDGVAASTPTNPYRAASPAPGAAAPVAAPTQAPANSGHGRSLDDLLEQAVPGSDQDLQKSLASSAPPSSPAPGATGLQQTPSRDQVVAAMHAIEPDVRACTHGQTLEANTAAAEITVMGATGRVNFVRVSGVQGAVASCIARAVRNAIFPPFSRGQLRVNFPFRLAP